MVNKAILIGNLGKDPQVRKVNNQSVASFSIATTERWTDNNGQRQEKTEWHNIVVWGKQADSCGQYLAKGRQVYVEGRIAHREYDDTNGAKQRITEIVARDVRFLGGGDGAPQQRSSQGGTGASAGATSGGGGGAATGSGGAAGAAAGSRRRGRDDESW